MKTYFFHRFSFLVGLTLFFQSACAPVAPFEGAVCESIQKPLDQGEEGRKNKEISSNSKDPQDSVSEVLSNQEKNIKKEDPCFNLNQQDLVVESFLAQDLNLKIQTHSTGELNREFSIDSLAKFDQHSIYFHKPLEAEFSFVWPETVCGKKINAVFFSYTLTTGDNFFTELENYVSISKDRKTPYWSLSIDKILQKQPTFFKGLISISDLHNLILYLEFSHFKTVQVEIKFKLNRYKNQSKFISFLKNNLI